MKGDDMKWYLSNGMSPEQKKRPASCDIFIGNTPDEAVAGAVVEYDRQIRVLEVRKKLVAAEIRWQAAEDGPQQDAAFREYSALRKSLKEQE
jgi:hypothetical protein